MKRFERESLEEGRTSLRCGGSLQGKKPFILIKTGGRGVTSDRGPGEGGGGHGFNTLTVNRGRSLLHNEEEKRNLLKRVTRVRCGAINVGQCWDREEGFLSLVKKEEMSPRIRRVEGCDEGWAGRHWYAKSR